ncbi:hypothetical protein [[Clostridium] fimetarium]|uniref:Transcriptional regulator, AbiEi antitoxin, Type IV TA system n=1 Tax=[Clostridium] fimetarium TaxID=99656 RepID=A0A1I0NJE2_9FIRM|nr:hypothetical protein [[Clostridium] fimetarium]SEW01420.1 hypothetical protein SAMN05421659_103146 [[Clostridium] fimetarium]
MSCRIKIEEYVDGLDDEDIIFISKLYSEKFSKYSEGAFFKIMERMVKEKKLVRLSKGIYFKNSENYTYNVDTILNYYFGENNDNGMYIGYQLYHKYGISDAIKDYFELYSTIVDQDKKNIGNIAISKVPMELNYDNTRIIEAFEILQNYDSIEKFSKEKFSIYARQFALGYNDESALRVLEKMKYKKSSIAFMKSILDMYRVNNSLGKYLNCASKYKIPKVSKVK